MKTGDAMNNHLKSESRDSAADACAIFTLIMIVVATAVFWVSHQ